MATAKKGKKTSGSKKSSRSKKKNGGSNFFTKFILTLLVLAMIVAAVFLTLNNLKIEGSNDTHDKTEVVLKKDKSKNEDEPIEPIVKTTETKKEVAKKEEPKKEEIKKEQKTVKKEDSESKKESKKLKILEGCWHSSEQGAFITIDQLGYRIDFSNVDASKPLTGNYYFENNLITFTSDGNECNGIEGTYRITFYKKDFSLICKDDDCTSRRNILEADWEWVEL